MDIQAGPVLIEKYYSEVAKKVNNKVFSGLNLLSKTVKRRYLSFVISGSNTKGLKVLTCKKIISLLLIPLKSTIAQYFLKLPRFTFKSYIHRCCYCQTGIQKFHPWI